MQEWVHLGVPMPWGSVRERSSRAICGIGKELAMDNPQALTSQTGSSFFKGALVQS